MIRHFCCRFSFFFYLTYLVVQNSIKIFQISGVCDGFDDGVKQTIKNINHSCLTVLSIKRFCSATYYSHLEED